VGRGGGGRGGVRDHGEMEEERGEGGGGRSSVRDHGEMKEERGEVGGGRGGLECSARNYRGLK